MSKFVREEQKFIVTSQMMEVEIKRQKTQKKCVIKRKLNFENYKNCLEATKPEIKIEYLDENNSNIDSL